MHSKRIINSFEKLLKQIKTMSFIQHCLKQIAEGEAAKEKYVRDAQMREAAIAIEEKKQATKSARSTARSNAKAPLSNDSKHDILSKKETQPSVKVKRIKQPAPKQKSLSEVWGDLKTANKAFGVFKKKNGQPMRERELLWAMMSGKRCMNYKELLQILLKSGDKNMLSPVEIKVLKGKRNAVKKLLNTTDKEKVRAFMRKHADISDVLVDVVSSLQKESKNQNIIDSDDDDQTGFDEGEINDAEIDDASDFTDVESADEYETE